MASQNVTISDVAEEAGVSVATVSRAFNKPQAVTESTREHIRQVAEKLRYVPHSAARSLKTSKTQTLGVILPDVHGAFFSEVIRGIDRTAQSKNYHILLSSSHSSESERNIVLEAMNGRVDGLLIMAPALNGKSIERHIASNVPVHLMNSGSSDGLYHSIKVDNHQGAYKATQHLANLGHSRIAIITGGADNFDARERLRGFRDALQDREVEIHKDYLVEGGFTETSGYHCMKKLLALESPPTAVFASNDSMAIGALSALSKENVDVPSEMALVGFDDIPMAAYTSPPLTTVHVDIQELGARAAANLLRMIEGEVSEPSQEAMSVSLKVRLSCGSQNSSTYSDQSLQQNKRSIHSDSL